ncbi:esiB, partial [Symbiodinium sp. KB8]
MGGWRGMEESCLVKRLGMSGSSPVHSVRSFLSPVDARELSDCLASADDYDTDADSVDSCPTFEFYPFQRGRWKNEALRTLLEDVVERRLLPYVRQRFGEERMALSEVLVRRYLPEERRTHAAHYDGHAFATAVLGPRKQQKPKQEPKELEWAQEGIRTVRLEPGDLLVHSFDLQHGVEVTQGSRYSLIFWLKDSPEAVATGTTPWYEKAAAAGEPDALYNLGIQRELGLHGQEIDLQKAKEAYLKSAELGHHFSQNNLALLYQEHPELDVDGRGSLHWMRLAAASGFAVAQKNLGTMLMEEGNSELAAESREWLRRAAEQREPEAAFFLGEIYREGLGVAPSLSEAQRWYRESAALGFFLASTELGLLAYQAGSFAEAEQHLEAAVQGDAEAWGYLATVRMCLGKGSSAAAIWQRLSDRGDAEAQFHLGTCFLRGSGVGVDEERALQLLQASCDAGSERAAALLQELDNVSDWAEM